MTKIVHALNKWWINDQIHALFKHALLKVDRLSEFLWLEAMFPLKVKIDHTCIYISRARFTRETNRKIFYHTNSDLTNTSLWPTNEPKAMVGVCQDIQEFATNTWCEAKTVIAMWRLLIANRTYTCQSRRTIKYITLGNTQSYQDGLYTLINDAVFVFTNLLSKGLKALVLCETWVLAATRSGYTHLQ